MWLYTPVLAEPPLYSMRDLQEWVTLDHALDAHELLDVRRAMSEKAAQSRV